MKTTYNFIGTAKFKENLYLHGLQTKGTEIRISAVESELSKLGYIRIHSNEDVHFNYIINKRDKNDIFTKNLQINLSVIN